MLDDVYQCAVQHLAFVFGALPKLSALADQWRRAATAIPMNIGEAVGTPFAIARGEAMECGVILDVVRMLAMLTKLCR
jgi:four helix bundle protein